MTTETDIQNHSRDLIDDDLEKLIDRLNSLREGASAVAGLVACGERAVEPLRSFLLEGRPSGIFQPRQRAVEALAELGAKDVLIEYLTSEKPISDPVASYGEEAVANAAARLLAGWRDKEVYEVLLWPLRRKQLPGLIDGVGEFRRTEALP
jgi:HEAT repeat protein